MTTKLKKKEKKRKKKVLSMYDNHVLPHTIFDMRVTYGVHANITTLIKTVKAFVECQ